MPNRVKLKWINKPQEDDYPAVASNLSLTMDRSAVRTALKKLKKAKLSEFAAKDIFRASGLPLLGPNNSHVKKDIVRIGNNELSPLLLYKDTVVIPVRLSKIKRRYGASATSILTATPYIPPHEEMAPALGMAVRHQRL